MHQIRKSVARSGKIFVDGNHRNVGSRVLRVRSKGRYRKCVRELFALLSLSKWSYDGVIPIHDLTDVDSFVIKGDDVKLGQKLLPLGEGRAFKLPISRV